MFWKKTATSMFLMMFKESWNIVLAMHISDVFGDDFKRIENCETQLLTDQKLSSPIFTCCLVGCPDRWHIHLSPLFDVLDHTNHTFSESLWHPLYTDPLTTHPSPTQTHQTHQTHPEPNRPDHFSTHSAVFKPYIFWNLMASTIHWHIALTTSPSPTQTHKTHHYKE